MLNQLYLVFTVVTMSNEGGKIDREEDYGYDFFPERAGKKEKTFMAKLIEGRASGHTLKCVANVYWCSKNDYIVKLLMNALKSYGCPVNISRHISCEKCLSRVNGGFDPKTNQVVVCENNSKSRAVTCSVLAHELTHVFDYCRAKVDFKNLEHLACTEVRAANFMHCSYMTAVADGDASIYNVSNRQRACVRRKAIMSVLMVRNVDLPEAERIVDKVFEKCYNDLEPLGRIPRRGSRDPQRMFAEGFLYGYSST